MEKFLVITNKDFDDEEIYYCGDVEFEAFKKFKELPHKMKQIVKAKVEICKLQGIDFIKKYEVIERIK